jgi:uncharacterized membrane protein
MESRIKVLGHPAHQAFVVLPAGLLLGATIFDIIAMGTSRPEWAVTTTHTLAAGIVAGALAAPVGTLDYLAIPPGTRAKRIGMLHGISNVVALLFFTASWLLRVETPIRIPFASHVLLFAGFAVVSLAAWFGGELVSRLGVGVSASSHLDATSSLRSSKADAERTPARGAPSRGRTR